MTNQEGLISDLIEWSDARELGLRGQAWSNEGRESPYDRFPAALQPGIPQKLWRLGTNSAGLYCDFRTSAKNIYIRWTAEPATTVNGYSAPCGASGYDLYGRDSGGVWRWVGSQESWRAPDCDGRLNRAELDGQEREYRLYFPLRTRVLEVLVGGDSELKAALESDLKKVAYYGTSIVHGAGVSRPGLTHAAQIARRFNLEVWNLGVCGHAYCEPEICTAIGRLDPDLFLFDVLPNNSEESIGERLGYLINSVRVQHPATPIVLIGDRVFGDASFLPQREQIFEKKNAAQRQLFDKLVSAGDKNLFLITHPSWFGDDFEGTSDASHPNDLGAARMAAALGDKLAHFFA